mgnify:CR=1 FL=1
MKGIVLAGGTGSRLYPATRGLSKQLLPVYDKPMIYYPLSVLMLAGIREILIVSSPRDLPRYRELLDDGEQWGVSFQYAEQPAPNGTAEALLIGSDFVAGDRVCVILGDNLFYGDELRTKVRRAASREVGATIFGYPVSNPEQYGVVAFDEQQRVTDIQEKPSRPKSEYAITGLYFYDARAVEMARALTPSERGELELTDINRRYLDLGELHAEQFGRGMAWLDTGTHEDLLKASNFIGAIQQRVGLKIACLEEIAYREGWISSDGLLERADQVVGDDYAEYLRSLVNHERADEGDG